MANARLDHGVSSPTSRSREDVILDDDNLPGLLKGLIDQQKLQGAWSRIGNRLRSAEDDFAKTRKRLDKLPQEFVGLSAYKDLVETSHAEQLQSHTQALEQLNDLTGRLSNIVFNEHQSELQESLARLKRQEDVCVKMQQDVEESDKKAEEFRTTILSRLGRADAGFQQFQGESGTRHSKLQDEMQERFTKLWDELKGSEGRMQRFAQGMCESAIQDALSFDKVGDTQRHLLAMIDRELVDAVRQEHLKIHDRVIKLSHDHDVSRTDTARHLRIVEQKASSCQDGLNTFKKDMHQELEKHLHLTDMEAIEQSLRTELTGLSGICEGLQTRTIIKMNEFVDHLGKLHETIDGHEHCLRHHAEEIENRSTKYELLLSQIQIEKCVEQEQHDAQLADLKQVVTWNTGKIEGMGLQKSTGSKNRKGDKEHHSPKLSPRLMASSKQKTDVADTSLSPRSVAQVGKNGEVEVLATDTSCPDEFELLAGPDAGAVGGHKAMTAPTTPMIPASPTAHPAIIPKDGEKESRSEHEDIAELEHAQSKLNENLQRANEESFSHVKEQEQHIEPSHHSPEDDSEADRRGSVISVSTRDVFRQQVEALAMALVSTAHMALAPPKLGQSSQARNDLKSELLEQLRDLRHWVTHQRMPPGWDPSKLTTMALRLAHQDPSQNSVRHSGRSSKRHVAQDPQAWDASCEDNETEPQRKSVARKSTKLTKSLVHRSRHQSGGAEATDALARETLFAGSPLQDEEPRSRPGEHNMPELDIALTRHEPSANNVSGLSQSARNRSLVDPGALYHHASSSARSLQLPPLTSSGQVVGFSHGVR